MFTGHDGPTAINVYWSVAIFTSDRTSGPMVKFSLYKLVCESFQTPHQESRINNLCTLLVPEINLTSVR